MTIPNINEFLQDYSLTEEQRQVLQIIADYSSPTGTARFGPQLRLIVSGRQGTGKSMLIGVVEQWFLKLNKRDELGLTATSGAAAANIGGRTLHTALDIPIIRGDGYRAQEMSQDRKLEWASEKYFLVIDEFQRMDSIAWEKLDQQLHSLRPEPTDPFGGFHIVFVGDFLQLPAVSGLYITRANQLVCKGLYSDEKLTLPSRSSNTASD